VGAIREPGCARGQGGAIAAPAVIDGLQFDEVRTSTDLVRLRAFAAGNVQVTEYESDDREGPPAHTHLWDEVEYVIDGTAEFLIDGEWVRGGPGTVQLLPAGAAHSVRIPEGTARLLLVTIGAPYDGFARDLARVADQGGGGAEIVAAARRHGVELA